MANNETQDKGFKTYMLLTFGTLNPGTQLLPNEWNSCNSAQLHLISGQ